LVPVGPLGAYSGAVEPDQEYDNGGCGRKPPEDHDGLEIDLQLEWRISAVDQGHDEPGCGYGDVDYQQADEHVHEEC